MKLIKHDSSQMVFKTQPNAFTVGFMLFWGLGFAGIPLFMAIMMVGGWGAININCDRLRWNQVNCQISKTQYFGLIAGETTKIDQIVSAKNLVLESKDSDGDRTVEYLVNISTKTRDVTYGQSFFTVNGVKGSFEDSIFVANTLNQFLTASDLKLNKTQNFTFGTGNFLSLLFFSPFLLFGFGAIYFVLQTTTLTLDKNLSQVTRRNISVLGLRVKSFPLANANKVEIEDYTDSYNNTFFTPVIKLTSGEKFAMERVGHRDQALIMANQIRQFLYLPTESK